MPKRSYLGDFELMVLLALLRLGEDAYGVPISREIEQQSGREVAVGTVYAALERLEEKDLVSSELGESTPQRLRLPCCPRPKTWTSRSKPRICVSIPSALPAPAASR